MAGAPAARRLRAPRPPGHPSSLARAHPPAADLTSGWRGRAQFLGYRAAAAVASGLPEQAVTRLTPLLARAAAPLLRQRGAMVARHAQRVRGGHPLTEREERLAVEAVLANYLRYWAESLALPSMDRAAIDARFTIEGLEHIDSAVAAGTGAVLAIPHLGGWDVGGVWLVGQGYPLTVVVESLEPPELFEWFVDLRRSFGFTVIPLDRSAGSAVLRALHSNQVVALLADRDIGGGGIEVEFFGERTTLPGGPATLALRAGAPILPTAIYFAGAGHHTVIRPPLDMTRTGRFREEVGRVTQALAGELEVLIRAAPEQWHLVQANWPSDRQ